MTNEYTQSPVAAAVDAAASVPRIITADELATRKKPLYLTVTLSSGDRQVPFELTRLALVKAEREGIFSINEAENKPLSYVYDLAYIALINKLGIKAVSRDMADEAVERYLNGGGTFEQLGEHVSQQVSKVFGIAEPTGGVTPE